MRRTALLTIALCVLAVGCGGSSSSDLTGTNNNGNPSGPLSATIDGTAWASPVPSAIYKNNILSVAGLDLGLTASVGFATGGVTGPGVYSLSFGNQLAGSGIISKGSQGWTSGLQGGTGTLNLTTVTANHVVGTFAFDAVAASGGATGVVHVTNGKFDITF